MVGIRDRRRCPERDEPAAHLRALAARRRALYRGAAAALLLSGLGFSAAAPQIATFLVRELDTSLTTAGLYYLTNLTAPVAGYLIGARSDRTGRRLGLFRLCAVIGGLGWAGIALSTQLWMPFVLSALALAVAGAADGSAAAVGADGGAVAAEGPGGQGTGVAGRPRPGLVAMLRLLAFTALYVCVYAGESIKYAYLPLHMSDDLHLPAAVSGAVIGIQPLVELVLMPFAVIAGRRFGMLRLMVVGAGCGVAANLLFGLSGSVIGLFAGQVIMGGVWGVFAVLGIIVAQRLLPGAVATASVIFLSSTAISSALGGALGGIGAGAMGLPLVFLLPGALGVIAVLGLVVMDRRLRGRVESAL